MTDKKSIESRRKLLKSITAGSGAIVAGTSLPKSWSRPVIGSVVLPAHAQTSCTDRDIVNMRTSLDLLNGGDARFSINEFLGGNREFRGSWTGTDTRNVTINDTDTFAGCTVTFTVTAVIDVPPTGAQPTVTSLSWDMTAECTDGNMCTGSDISFVTVGTSGNNQSDIFFDICTDGTECCTQDGILPINNPDCSPSDRNIKMNFADIDEQEILRKVSNLSIESWNYTDREQGVRHIGPMAQDFMASFNVGGSDKVINMVDANGVNLAAIKALNSKLEEKDAQILSLQEQLNKVINKLNKLG
jgi:hypothetical protein